MLTRRTLPSLFVVLTISVVALALAGCGMSAVGGNSATQSTVAPAAQPGHIAGLAHGGRQPIAGAQVALWAAGTTVGYGQGATLVATTTTDGNGNFNLDTSGTTSPCTAGQYLYITITGGNPGGGTNSSSALMEALPQPCNTYTGTNTGGLSLTINEATTVASVWALQQFLSITPANVSAFASSPTAANAPWQIGAPSTNTTGLANAFSQISQVINNLATSQIGTSVVASTVTGGSTPGDYITLIFPDTNRYYVVSNILSACVNSVDGQGNTGSGVCTSLFTDVSPSGAVLPADTIQAAYDIATAPGGFTEYPRPATPSGTIAAGTALTTPTWGTTCSGVGCEWALAMCEQFVPAAAPFTATACSQGTGAASYPTDFLAGVRWQAYDPAGHLDGVYNGAVAVDSNGNIWSAATKNSASSTGNPLVEWDPQGHVLQTFGSSAGGSTGQVVMPSSAVNVAMVNSSGYYVANANFSYSTPPTVTIVPATGTSVFTNFGIAIDSNNNLWAPVNGIAPTGYAITSGSYTFNSGLLLEIGPATVTTVASAPPTSTNGYQTVTAISGNGTTATITAANTYTVGENVEFFGFTVAGDTALNGATFAVQSATATNFTINSSVTTTGTGYVAPAVVHATSTAGTVTPYITGYTPGPIAIDASNNIWLNTRATSTSAYNPLTVMTAASNYLTIYENQYETAAGQDVVVDGLGYAWATSNQTAAGKFIARSTLSSAQSTNTTSNSGFNAWNIAGTNYATSPAIAPHFIFADNYDNIWVSESTNSGSGSIVYFAVPGGPASAFNPLPTADILYKTSSTSSASAAANAYTGGLTNPTGVGLDGLGNIWTANGVNSGGAGLSEFVVNGATAGAGGTILPVSPTNSSTGMTSYGFNDDTTNSPTATTIDGSGNLFFGGVGNYVTHMLGAAAPLITPAVKALTPVNATITAWSIGASTATATFTATNSYPVGQKVLLSGFTTTTAFNGQLVQVTASTGSTFTATLYSATGLTANTSNTENGVASTTNTVTRP